MPGDAMFASGVSACRLGFRFARGAGPGAAGEPRPAVVQPDPLTGDDAFFARRVNSAHCHCAGTGSGDDGAMDNVRKYHE